MFKATKKKVKGKDGLLSRAAMFSSKINDKQLLQVHQKIKNQARASVSSQMEEEPSFMKSKMPESAIQNRVYARLVKEAVKDGAITQEQANDILFENMRSDYEGMLEQLTNGEYKKQFGSFCHKIAILN